MSLPISKVEIRSEHDIVLARQKARLIAGQLGFAESERTRISTAVSEIARNALVYAGGGELEFAVEETKRPQLFAARITDCGPAAEKLAPAPGSRQSPSEARQIGIAAARRLMDHFEIESKTGPGATVFMGKRIPDGTPVATAESIAALAAQIITHQPQSLFEEVQQQNQELLRAMEELKQRQEELEALNHELTDTNRGIVALYKELDDQASRLQRANELKAHFLSNVSHEFKTPLNCIISLARLLTEHTDGDLNAEQEKQVRWMRQSAEELSGMVNDLLDLGKIDAGKIVVRPAEIHVDMLFSTLRGMFKPLVVRPAVALVFEPPEGLPAIYTDEGKLSQILRNFLSNAIKFTEAGEIGVSATSADGGSKVVFAVSDTGIGIAPEHQRLIFDEYMQVDSSLQRKTRGTGLGLPLSRKLAELLGGVVTVKSTVGRGSCFTAVIPAVYPGEGESTAAQKNGRAAPVGDEHGAQAERNGARYGK